MCQTNTYHYSASPPLCLKQTLFCGQCFHWRQTAPNTFQGVIDGVLYTAVQNLDGTASFYWGENGNERAVVRFFDLDRDYGALHQKMSKNPILKEALLSSSGIRLCGQDPWETLLSFILSQNNNISRITGLVFNLCQLFGTPVENGFYTFPSAQKLSGLTLEDLVPLKAGFRGKYLLDAAHKVCANTPNLNKLHDHRDDFVKKQLMQICGVGPKVADCVLLFGFSRHRVVPMDVWMKRVMSTFFNGKMPRCACGYEGIAQQYLFDYARQNPALFQSAF